VDQDIYKLTPEKRRELSVKELPGSLAEAVESVKSDSEFLSPIFPGDLLGVMMELEMENYRAVSARPHLRVLPLLRLIQTGRTRQTVFF